MRVPVHTCFEPLVDGEATERPLSDLLWDEWRDAVVNGLEAAAVVLAVLLWQGTPAWLAMAAALGAIALGAALHQVVLVAGALVLRRWRGGPTPSE